MTQLAISALGLGALLAASTTAFAVLKWCGALYLCALGWRQWRAPARLPKIDAAAAQASVRSLYVRGLLINLSNPKGVLFMLAVLPQFIDPSAPQVPQYAICAATLVFTDLVVMNAYTGFAARVLRFWRSERQVRWMNRTFGGLFLAAGALLASFKRAV